MPALNFPFTAIIGQPLFKLALILTGVNPAIGGVLVSGPRGSAKSTLARSLVDIAPLDHNGSRQPFLTLPLGATEEMLVGTLNLQDVLKEQTVSFQEGLLAKANGGVLYVDEVNLLQDNLVDLLLDVSASGVNVIERDGISHSHAARFLLLGSMNPDEGELRPQLQDRFGFSVILNNEYSLEERVAIVKAREAFDANPQDFIKEYQGKQDELSARISQAKNNLPSVICSDALRCVIAERCQEANVDGLRADIVWYRAALAHAAWQASDDKLNEVVKEADKAIEVTLEDVDAVEALVLAHRRGSQSENPPQKPDSKDGKGPSGQKPFSRPASSYSSEAGDLTEKESENSEQGDWGQMPGQQQLGADINSPLLEERINKLTNNRGYKKVQADLSQFFAKAKVQTSVGSALNNKGRVGHSNSRSVNWFNSLVANMGAWPLKQLRYRRAKTGQAVLHLVLLDTSASTLQNKLLAHAKASVLSIAKSAYLHREQLTIVGFGNQEVKTLLPQKKSPKELRAWLDSITAGGGTPLCDALDMALKIQQKHYRQSPELAIKTYLITDGRTTQDFARKKLLGEVIVIDTEQSTIKRGKGREIAQTLNADYIPLFA